VSTPTRPLREPSDLIGSAQRALRVLEVVGAERDGITAKAVARRAGYKLATTYHLLNTLVHEGYLIRLGHGRGFGLGYKVNSLYRQLCQKVDVGDRVRDQLTAMHLEVGAPAYYTVFRARSIVVAAVADSPQYPRAEPLGFGFHEAAHATAFGKVMLASLGRRDRLEYLAEQGLPRLTPATTVTADRLEAEVAQVGRAGFAYEVEEFLPRVACLAAAVSDGEGRIVGAAALSVPVETFSRRRQDLEHALRAGARRIGRLLAAGCGETAHRFSAR
jgi:DNA-binding IclR family transcriptional regulator